MLSPEWIAVDWGTSRLRAWAMSADDAVLAEAVSDRGMGALSPVEFEPALLEVISGWIGETAITPVVACGMVGARQGWIEAPYGAVPCRPIQTPMAVAPAIDPRIRVSIVPGLKQAHPADVMRGEETQIAGLIASRPAFDGLVCLPGTHTKWARIERGRVIRFRSFMTGELFAVLEKHSVLKHSLASSAFDKDVFEECVQAVVKESEPGIAGLFSIRAEDLLNGVPPEASRATLSARLIGSEVAAIGVEASADVALIGAPDLIDLYAIALSALGVTPTVADATSMTLGGLIAAKEKLEAG